MRVVHLSTSDIGHGAGIAAFRLHKSLKQLGIESQMLVAEKLSSDPDVATIDPGGSSFCGRALRSALERAELAWNELAAQNAIGFNEWWLRNAPALVEADVVNLHALHWPKRHIPYGILRRVIPHRKIVWTFHDMWALTGHCSYSYDCTRWKIGCGQCPDLDSFIRVRRDTTRETFQSKLAVYRESSFTVVSPSKWLAGVARESPLFSHLEVRHIPYGIDSALYSPRPKEEARRAFGLPADKPVIAAIAHDFSDQRKGARHLQAAMAKLPRSHDGTTLLCLGRGEPGPVLHERFNVVRAGYLTEPHLLATAYSAADLLVFPTIADNLPNVVLESMACGTPVVSFRVGGVPDLVGHLEHGYLAALKDDDDLSRGIDRLLSNRTERLAMGVAGRTRMEVEFPYLGQARAYSELYSELLQKP